MLAEKRHVTDALCVVSTDTSLQRCQGFAEYLEATRNVSTDIIEADHADLNEAMDQDGVSRGVRARAVN